MLGEVHHVRTLHVFYRLRSSGNQYFEALNPKVWDVREATVAMCGATVLLDSLHDLACILHG